MKIYDASEYGVKPGLYCEKALEDFLSSIAKDEDEKIIAFEKGTYLIDATKLHSRNII